MGKGKALSVDLRERIASAVLVEGLTYAETATRFVVGPASVSRIVGKARRAVSLVPGIRRPPPKKLSDADRATLVAILEATPDATIPEIREQLLALIDTVVSVPTVGREIRALAFTRKKRRS